MKKFSVVFLIFACILGLFVKINSQSFIKNEHVKKQTTGVIVTQMDTLRRVATNGTRLSTGSSSTNNGFLPDTLWSITGTAVDTSRVYRVKSGRITFGFDFANDSTDIRFRLHAAQDRPITGTYFPSLSDFALVDSNTVSTNNKDFWVYTSAGSNRPNWDFYYLSALGGGNNNKDAANTGTVIVSY